MERATQIFNTATDCLPCGAFHVNNLTPLSVPLSLLCLFFAPYLSLPFDADANSDVCGRVELTPMAIAAGRRLADRLFGVESVVLTPFFLIHFKCYVTSRPPPPHPTDHPHLRVDGA